MQKVFRITVDISKKIPAPAFEVNTNDLKSVKLEITITNGQSLLDLTGVTPRINIRKPDNEVIFQDCEVVDAKAGKVQIVLENQAYLVPGTHTAEIACYKGNEITAITGTFSYKSVKGIMNDEAVESKSEFTAIDRKIAEARKLLEDIGENGVGVDEQARQEIQEVTAQLADTSQQLSYLESNKADNERIDNIIAQSGTSDTEIVDARNSSVKNKTFSTVKNRFDETELEVASANDIIANAIQNGVAEYSKTQSVDAIKSTNFISTKTFDKSLANSASAYNNGFVAPHDLMLKQVKTTAKSTKLNVYIYDSEMKYMKEVLDVPISNGIAQLSTPLFIPKGGTVFIAHNADGLFYYKTGEVTKGINTSTKVARNETVYVAFDLIYSQMKVNWVVGEKVSEIEDSLAGLGSSVVQMTDYFMPRYKETENQYELYGRWFDRLFQEKYYKMTNNQGSQIFFKVKGTLSVDVNLQQRTAAAIAPYIVYSIDGGEYIRQQITTPTIPLPDTNEHVVRIMIDGMTENDPSQGKWTSYAGIMVMSINPNGGTLKGLKPMNRTIMFFGDSIVEGINTLATGANANVNSASKAFPAICANQLNSIPYFVGYGGTGVLSNGSFQKFISAIDYYHQTLMSGSETPDVIVIEHGYNDNSLINAGTNTQTDYVNGYNNALNRLKIKYPGVPIVCVVPFKAQTMKPLIEQCISNRSYCYLVDTEGWDLETTDNVHLSVNGAYKGGIKLADELTRIFGKQFFMG